MSIFSLNISKSIGEDGARIYIGSGVKISLYDDYLVWDNGIVNREIARIFYSDIISVTYSNGNFVSGAFISISTAGKNYTARASSEYKDYHEMANAIEDMRHKAKNNTRSFPESNVMHKPTGNFAIGKTSSEKPSENSYYLYESRIDEDAMISILESVDNGQRLEAIMMIRDLANVGISDAKFIVENIGKIDFHIPQSKKTLIAIVNAISIPNESESHSNNQLETYVEDISDMEDPVSQHEAELTEHQSTNQVDSERFIWKEELLSQQEDRPEVPLTTKWTDRWHHELNDKSNGRSILAVLVCCLLLIMVMSWPTDNISEKLLRYKETAMDHVQNEIRMILDEYSIDENEQSEIVNGITVAYEKETIEKENYEIIACYEIPIDSDIIVWRMKIEGTIGENEFKISRIDLQ